MTRFPGRKLGYVIKEDLPDCRTELLVYVIINYVSKFEIILLSRQPIDVSERASIFLTYQTPRYPTGISMQGLYWQIGELRLK